MSVSLKKSIALWRKEAWGDNARYGQASKSFVEVLDLLLARGRKVTAAQADCLYRILRFEGKHSVRRKIEYIGEVLGPKAVAKLKLNPRGHYGLIGGTLGSIRPKLRSSEVSYRLVTFLRDVRRAKDTKTADNIVREYLLDPIPGLGRSVISSFLFAVRPKDYPIVNGGVDQGLAKVVETFSTNPDVSRYIDSHVMRLRIVRERLGFRTFGEFDSYFGYMNSYFAGTIAKHERLSPLAETEKKRFVGALEVEEGHRRSTEVEISLRNPRARLAALA